jgi:DNA mismatch endonuclease (patch repair protein)
MDKISSERRSLNMSKIRSKDTKPELKVRRLLFSKGYRYRIHVSDLPGKPDLVFVRKRVAIFVHGCFWHCHPKESCLDSKIPKSNSDYWLKKLQRNVVRDAESLSKLQELGWRVLVIWDCETRDDELLLARIEDFLAET